MKKNLQLVLASVLALSVTFISCKKTDTTPDTTEAKYTELQTQADDQARFSAENDAVDDDVNASIESYDAFNGREYAPSSIVCNANTVLDSTNTLRRITITYDGLNCQGTRIRHGVVVLSMPLHSHWREAGAVLTVDIQQLKITRVRDNKSITINGATTITNVLGGRLRNLAILGHPIQHDIASAGLSVTFDNGTVRSWQVAKRRVFTFDGGVVITATGTHTDGSITGISEWGTTRFGNPFVTSITSPLVVREDCGFRLVSGEVKHQRLVATAVTTFGLDATGNPTTCPGAGTYYYKTVWTGANGVVRTVINPY